MSDKFHYADIHIDNGTPYSTHFGDIYFSPEDAINESNYNFIVGNQLPKRFSELSHGQFTIAETGFGTGLNFLIAANLWQKTAKKGCSLHYISVEKHPIPIVTLSQIYQENQWQNEIANKLLTQYQHCTSEYNIIQISDNIRLSLLIGDASEKFQSLSFLADAWFLDGFAPSKNPELWSLSLFKLMAQRTQKNGSFATFTAASIVRKNLISAGFTVNKGKGFGRKRERLLGYYLTK